MVKIILPENTRAVGKNAFKNCTNLELAAFYGNDTKFDKDVFEGASQAAIAGNEHSSVMKYANNNEIPFYQIVNVIYGGNNVNFDPMAFVVNNSTTLVPMRAVFEMLGADVDWDETSSTAIASKDGITISIQIGSSILYRNGEAITREVDSRQNLCSAQSSFRSFWKRCSMGRRNRRSYNKLTNKKKLEKSCKKSIDNGFYV